MRVHRFLKDWSLLTTKIIIDSPLKFFSKQEFRENLEFFGKPASYPFRKVIYVATNNLKLQSYSINSILALPIFSKFQLSANLTMKFNKLCAEI
jgi:hypothetical protein